MKVGTDGVLLGAWVGTGCGERTVADIGTGTGVIALMLAQRCGTARITALDIDPDCAAQARANADASPWGDRIDVVCTPVQRFVTDAPFDLVVSNPPFYDASLLPPDAGRAAARHTTLLSFADLAESACRLTAPEGRFAVVLPETEAARFVALATRRMWLTRRTEVRTTPRRGVRRVLLEFAFRAPEGGPLRSELSIMDMQGGFTPEYRELTRDFYLRF